MSEPLKLKVKDGASYGGFGVLVGEAVRVSVGLGVDCLGFEQNRVV